MSRQNHGVAADYYAVGVIGFELMTGKVALRSTHLETLHRKNEKGYQGSSVLKTSPIKEIGYPGGMGNRGRRLYQPGKWTLTSLAHTKEAPE